MRVPTLAAALLIASPLALTTACAAGTHDHDVVAVFSNHFEIT